MAAAFRLVAGREPVRQDGRERRRYRRIEDAGMWLGGVVGQERQKRHEG
jgi:hypothetical protein